MQGFKTHCRIAAKPNVKYEKMTSVLSIDFCVKYKLLALKLQTITYVYQLDKADNCKI